MKGLWSNLIRLLTPPQAAGNALAIAGSNSQRIDGPATSCPLSGQPFGQYLQRIPQTITKMTCNFYLKG